MTYLVDSDICIYAMKHAHPSLQRTWMAHDAGSIGVPAIVKGEMLTGAMKSRNPAVAVAKVLEFLGPFEVLAFDDGCAVHYAAMRARLERTGKPIGPNDCLIAATALASGRILVTHNVREFSRVPGLKIEDWAQ
jgi:tRNA(fMet)-specific endonuclease VapC